jgi:hypothetical protein
MRTLQRAAAVVGLTLMTGGILGITATAASAAPASPGQTENTTQGVEDGRSGGDHDGRGNDWGRDRGRGNDWDRGRGRDRSYIAGWFPSRGMCEAYGWAGERRGKWEDPHCYQVGRHSYVLKVEPSHWRRWHR